MNRALGLALVALAVLALAPGEAHAALGDSLRSVTEIMDKVRYGYARELYTIIGQRTSGLFKISYVIYILFIAGKVILFEKDLRALKPMGVALLTMPVVSAILFMPDLYSEWVVAGFEKLGLYFSGMALKTGYKLGGVTGAFTDIKTYGELVQAMLAAIGKLIGVALMVMLTGGNPVSAIGYFFMGLVLLLAWLLVAVIFIGILFDAILKTTVVMVASPILIGLTVFGWGRQFWLVSLRYLFSAGLGIFFASVAMGLTICFIEPVKRDAVCSIVGYEHPTCQAIPPSAGGSIFRGDPAAPSTNTDEDLAFGTDLRAGKLSSEAYVALLIIAGISFMMHWKAATYASSLAFGREAAGAQLGEAVKMMKQAATGAIAGAALTRQGASTAASEIAALLGRLKGG